MIGMARIDEPLFMPLPPEMALSNMQTMPGDLSHVARVNIGPSVPPPPLRPAPCIEAALPPEAPSLPPGTAHRDTHTRCPCPSAAATSRPSSSEDATELEAPANDATALEIARQPSGITC